MTETIILRMIGGPNQGDRVGPVDKVGGWPPPETLLGTASGGILSPHVMRGAEYRWEAAS